MINDDTTWEVDADGDIVDAMTGEVMACLFDVNHPTRRGRLIAAAPDMRYLLKNIRSVITDPCPVCTVDSYINDIDELLAEIDLTDE